MKYTKSALLEVLDFCKKIIYIIDLIVQLLYICYLSYRIINDVGFLVTNTLLIIVSVIYLVYHLLTTREFYSKKQTEDKKMFKLIVKVLKRTINFVVILMSIYNLVNSPSINNIDILLTLLLILGFVFALFGDLFTKIINKQIINIWNSFKYDLHLFKEAHPIPGEQVYSYLNNNIAMKLNKVEVENIKKINYKQEMKKRRKNDFEKKTK